MNPPRETLVSRKTQQDVRLQLDKLDYTMMEEMLRRVIREELAAHEARKGQQISSYRHSVWCPHHTTGRAYG